MQFKLKVFQIILCIIVISTFILILTKFIIKLVIKYIYIKFDQFF